MTKANFGGFDREKFAFSVWVKRSTTGTQALFDIEDSGFSNRVLNIQFNASGQIIYRVSNNGSNYLSGQLTTTPTYTSTTNWYHFLFHYDSANSTSTDRMRMWVDGTEVTSFDTDTEPSSSVYNAAGTANVILGSRAGNDYFNGLMYQAAFFSGNLPTISQVYNVGAALDVKGISGLWSLLHTMDTGNLEDDHVITTDWTNNNTVTKSTTIP